MSAPASPTPAPAGGNPFGLGPPRDGVFPLRFHDLADGPLVELWDRRGATANSPSGLSD